MVEDPICIDIFPRACGCGMVHLSRAQWDTLPNRKVWHFDELLTAEMRDCACGSTLMIPIRLCEVITGRLAA